MTKDIIAVAAAAVSAVKAAARVKLRDVPVDLDSSAVQRSDCSPQNTAVAWDAVTTWAMDLPSNWLGHRRSTMTIRAESPFGVNVWGPDAVRPAQAEQQSPISADSAIRAFTLSSDSAILNRTRLVFVSQEPRSQSAGNLGAHLRIHHGDSHKCNPSATAW